MATVQLVMASENGIYFRTATKRLFDILLSVSNHPLRVLTLENRLFSEYVVSYIVQPRCDLRWQRAAFLSLPRRFNVLCVMFSS